MLYCNCWMSKEFDRIWEDPAALRCRAFRFDSNENASENTCALHAQICVSDYEKRCGATVTAVLITDSDSVCEGSNPSSAAVEKRSDVVKVV